MEFTDQGQPLRCSLIQKSGQYGDMFGASKLFGTMPMLLVIHSAAVERSVLEWTEPMRQLMENLLESSPSLLFVVSDKALPHLIARLRRFAQRDIWIATSDSGRIGRLEEMALGRADFVVADGSFLGTIAHVQAQCSYADDAVLVACDPKSWERSLVRFDCMIDVSVTAPETVLLNKVYGTRKMQPKVFFDRTSGPVGLIEGLAWFGVIDASLFFSATTDKNKSPQFTSPQSLVVPVASDATQFQIWAPRRRTVNVEILRGSRRKGRVQAYPLERHDDGFHRATINGVGVGDRYRYRLTNTKSRPDPWSRYQPFSVHEWSEVVNLNGFAWTDQEWKGISTDQLAIYELHIGTMSRGGNYDAVLDKIPDLKSLGITAIELMPIAQAPGRWNWGYDGVYLYAPNCNYGTPYDVMRFIDRCHAQGMGVILDVVYNHLGPEGNYLQDFGPIFSSRHHTPWGSAFDFDGPQRQIARDFVIDNAMMWLRDYHFDGLRLDAVHFMYDDSRPNILEDLATEVRQYERTAGRKLSLIAETNVYDEAFSISSPRATSLFDALWCDDLMHATYSAVSGQQPMTHRKYHGFDDIEQIVQNGIVYEGPTYRRVEKTEILDHGDIPRLVIALQTHDSVGNQPHGKRLHQLISASMQRAAATIFLLTPSIPMLFMGEEVSTDQPFRFFVDFGDDRLRKAVAEGRRREYDEHEWAGAISPTDEQAYWDSVLPDLSEESLAHNPTWQWYRQLLAIRKVWQSQELLHRAGMSVKRLDDATLCMYYNQGPRAASVVVRLGAQHGLRLKRIPASQIQARLEPTEDLSDGMMELGRVDALVCWGAVEVAK